MPTLADVNQNALFTMFKGEIGTRKSTQAMSFPKPQYWFSFEGKMDALILPARKWGIDFAKDIHFDDYNDWDKPAARLEKLQVDCPYKTIIIDSITSCGDKINSQTMGVKSGTKRQDGSEKGMKIGNINVNSLEDYKAEASAFMQLVSLLKDIHKFHKVNVILIAHVIGERKPEDKQQSTHFARIIVTGGKIISAKIPAYCSEVYHFDIKQNFDTEKEGEYGLVTVHTGDDFARTSLPLERRINFGDKPLYETYLKPAIEKNQYMKPTSTIPTTEPIQQSAKGFGV